MRFNSVKSKKTVKNEILAENLCAKISLRHFLIRVAVAMAGGVIFAMALPPLNWHILGFFTLAVLLATIWEQSVWRSMILGFAWGLGWSFPSFFWIREIHIAVPFLLAVVLACWPMVWAGCVAWLRVRILVPPAVRMSGVDEVKTYIKERLPMWRTLLFMVVISALWILLEFSRSTMLPWNNISTIAWQSYDILPLSSITGQYGIGFLFAMFSFSLFMGYKVACGARFMRFAPLVVTAILIKTLPMLATYYLEAQPQSEGTAIRIGAVQGDISQRRNADNAQAEEALDIYIAESEKLLQHDKMDLVVWPETAVPYSFKGVGEVCDRYRSELKRLIDTYKTPFLIGTIDFEFNSDNSVKGITNSALLIAPPFYEKARYDKNHRVPYGEYIPLRMLLPNFIQKMIFMNRDLISGNDFSPITIASGVNAGVAICFESVFAYVAREEARRGANMLLVISNDAWYPTSCEPEQHLANAVMRSVETGLYSLRCGNNGGTLLISPQGRILDVLETTGDEERLELRRGRGSRFFELNIPSSVIMTIYTKYGEWFVVLCGFITMFGFVFAIFSGYMLKNLHLNRQNR